MTTNWEKYVGHLAVAPRFSRKVEKASDAVQRAQKNLAEILKSEYPLGIAVRVVHDRGRYTGTVSGWDYHGSRIAVRNDATGKERKWWAIHVELLTGNSSHRPHR